MREIKCRAKSKSSGEWVYGAFLESYHSSRFGKIDAIFYSDDEKTHRIPVDKNTVGQFTGLQDKNSVGIYEGDVVKEDEELFEEFAAQPEVVHFAAGAFYPVCMQPSTTFEVIGNIYDNPELKPKYTEEI